MEDYFGKYGKIVDARVIMDRETSRSRGFAFVTFSDPRDADDAMKGLQGTELQGRPIRIDRSTPKVQGGGGGGFSSFGGGYGGGGGGYGGAPSHGGYDRGGGGFESRGGYDRGYSVRYLRLIICPFITQ